MTAAETIAAITIPRIAAAILGSTNTPMEAAAESTAIVPSGSTATNVTTAPNPPARSVLASFADFIRPTRASRRIAPRAANTATGAATASTATGASAGAGNGRGKGKKRTRDEDENEDEDEDEGNADGKRKGQDDDGAPVKRKRKKT
ncbi:hypothetical protein M501DRAFT_992830 [Patellaria atrata CBS 101060]|uniref:Uncharacterized protein n=1 Tax=Patellaria atrata CBS 101060 TaxID=1346257 RepID=A0A9P4VMP2_9PEZI|nr:hypothetical protein M501DRAFT_992830 [Patellaria atrata CBS 101060]